MLVLEQHDQRNSKRFKNCNNGRYWFIPYNHLGMQNAGWIVDNPATLIDFTNAGAWTHDLGNYGL